MFSLADVPAIRTTFPHLYGAPLAVDGAGVHPSEPHSLASPVPHPHHHHSSALGTPVAATGGLRVGIVFCGRQTPGAHNVVWGLYDALKRLHASNEVLGILDGTLGLYDGKHVVITDEVLAMFRNQGGMDLLSRTVDQVRGVGLQTFFS